LNDGGALHGKGACNCGLSRSPSSAFRAEQNSTRRLPQYPARRSAAGETRINHENMPSSLAEPCANTCTPRAKVGASRFSVAVALAQRARSKVVAPIRLRCRCRSLSFHAVPLPPNAFDRNSIPPHCRSFLACASRCGFSPPALANAIRAHALPATEPARAHGCQPLNPGARCAGKVAALAGVQTGLTARHPGDTVTCLLAALAPGGSSSLMIINRNVDAELLRIWSITFYDP